MREEVWSRKKEELGECYRKIDEEQLEFSERIRKFVVVSEEANIKYDAEKEELKKKREAEREPFQMNQVKQALLVTGRGTSSLLQKQKIRSQLTEWLG